MSSILKIPLPSKDPYNSSAFA